MLNGQDQPFLMSMKKILVLTDPSKSDPDLTQAAAKLANGLHCDVLLFSIYESIPMNTFYGASPWINGNGTSWQQESKDKLSVIAFELRAFILLSLPGERWRPEVTFHCEAGDLSDNLKNVLESEDIEMIVMGASKQSGFKHFLFGKNTNLVVSNATRPVLILAGKFEFKDLQKVLFATDFNVSDLKAVNLLAKYAEALHFDLELVHVDDIEDKQSEENVCKQVFLNMLEDINHPNLTHLEIHGKNVVQSLKRLCSRQGIDMLALLHHQDALLIRMLKSSTTKNILDQLTLPVIVFPSKMK